MLALDEYVCNWLSMSYCHWLSMHSGHMQQDLKTIINLSFMLAVHIVKIKDEITHFLEIQLQYKMGILIDLLFIKTVEK